MATYYLEMAPGQYGLTMERFWEIDGPLAHMNCAPSESGTFRAAEGEDAVSTIRRAFPNSVFHKLKLGPGEYYPRMSRPSSTRVEQSPGTYPDFGADAINIKTVSTGQLQALIQEFQRICRVVQPNQDNFDTYGHEIRNFLIIACTEVEAQWKNILQANHARAKGRSDYVKLSPVMKLQAYEVALPWYPWLAPIKPFENWVATPPSVQQDLPWYNAYNATKHDRENAFKKATLQHALSALSGCFVMLCAQYGWQFAKRPEKAGDAFFQLLGVPSWGPTDLYFFGNGSPPVQKDYPF